MFLYGPQEKSVYVTGSYAEKDIYFKDIKVSVENWFKARNHKVSQDDRIRTTDSISRASSSRRSRSSRHSSVHSSIVSARVAEEAKQAELAAKAACIKKKQELELARFKLELKKEELEL